MCKVGRGFSEGRCREGHEAPTPEDTWTRLWRRHAVLTVRVTVGVTAPHGALAGPSWGRHGVEGCWLQGTSLGFESQPTSRNKRRTEPRAGFAGWGVSHTSEAERVRRRPAGPQMEESSRGATTPSRLLPPGAKRTGTSVQGARWNSVRLALGTGHAAAPAAQAPWQVSSQPHAQSSCVSQ